ncbi:hypothetical protein ACFSUK_10305 [Sphingobium scionense]
MALGRLAWACLLTGLVAPSAVLAQHPDMQLDSRMFVERIQTDLNYRARRIVASPDRRQPGDQLIFIVDWRNTGQRPVRGYSLVRAVPRGTTLDLSDPTMQVSIDGGEHWGRIDQLWLPTPLGGTRRAIASDITHIRWLLANEIPPGESGRLSYRLLAR